MTDHILSCPIFDIEITASRDYTGAERYLLRYGLQTTILPTLAVAIREFNNAMHHARQCAGEFDAE